MSDLATIAAAILPLVEGADPPVQHGTVSGIFQVWQDNKKRGAKRRRWSLTVGPEGMPPDFSGDLTPLARAVLAAALPLLDWEE
jgi:hypothetical protein